MDNTFGISSSWLVLSIAAKRNCCVKAPPIPNKKLAKENNSNNAIFVDKTAKSAAEKRQLNPVKTANFLPLERAITAAGIEPAATPRIIKLIGKVASDGFVVSSLDSKPPINTIMGAEHITNGCAIKSKLIFRGKLNFLVSKRAEITISTEISKITAIINQNPLLKLF